MYNNFIYVLWALLATLFTWGCTALGAALVFLFRKTGQSRLGAMLAFSAGVMTAASFWSLLMPGVELARELGMNATLTLLCGLTLGGGVLLVKDVLFERTGRKSRRASMLLFSITLHNIPEGLAVGIAFGSIGYHLDGASLTAAMMLALGIGLQNIPEGCAVSLPLLNDGYSRGRAFFYGQLSAFVEVIAGVVGAVIALFARYALPFMLAFAAGAMIYVVTKELIPESVTSSRPERMTAVVLFGFILMTVLDVALG